MSSFLGWASSALTSVASSIGTPFGTAGPEARAPVQQLSSKRPANKRGGKKKAASKKASAGRKLGAADEATEATGSNDEFSKVIAEIPGANSTGLSSVEDEARVLGDDEGDSQSSADDEESQAVSKNASGLTEAALLEQQRCEKSKKKSQKAKERRKTKKSLLANSVLKSLPDDPLKAERNEIMAEMEQSLKELPKLEELAYEEAAEVYGDLQKSLDEFAISLDKSVRSMKSKLPRGIARGATIPEVRAQIESMEVAAEKDEWGVKTKVLELLDLMSVANHQTFASQIEDMKTRIAQMKFANTKALDGLRARSVKTKAVERLHRLCETLELDELKEKISVDSIATDQLDINADVQAVLYAPVHARQRIEKRFVVSIDNARSNQTSTAGNRSGSSRAAAISGLRENVDKCLEFFKTADFSGRILRKTYEKKLLGSIIGKGGSGLEQIESKVGAVIHISGVADITVFGTPEQATEVWELIDKVKTTVAEATSTADMNLEPLVLRAIQSVHKDKVLAFEQTHNARVIMNINDGKLVVKTKIDELAKVTEAARREFADKFTLLKMPCTSRAYSRLVIPRANATGSAQVKKMHEEFRALQESFVLFVERENKAGEGESFAADAPVGMLCVCYKNDSKTVEEKITDLISRADFTTLRMEIAKGQTRVFRAENRALLESKHQCRVNVVNNTEGAFLLIHGSDDVVVQVKQEAEAMLQREGRLISFTVENPDVIRKLLRNRAELLREIEEEHSVSISLRKETDLCEILGEDDAVTLAKNQILGMVKETDEKTAALERVEITVNADKVARIIGKAGASINEIRKESQVESIDIPKASSGQDTVVIKLAGIKEAVEKARSMIEKIVGTSQSQQASAASNSFETAERQSRRSSTNTASNAPSFDDQDLFPTIEAACNFKHKPLAGNQSALEPALF